MKRMIAVIEVPDGWSSDDAWKALAAAEGDAWRVREMHNPAVTRPVRHAGGLLAGGFGAGDGWYIQTYLLEDIGEGPWPSRELAQEFLDNEVGIEARLVMIVGRDRDVAEYGVWHNVGSQQED